MGSVEASSQKAEASSADKSSNAATFMCVSEATNADGSKEILTLKYTTMKELMRLIGEDYKKENFTKRDWVMAAIFFAALFGAICFAGWLERV